MPEKIVNFKEYLKSFGRDSKTIYLNRTTLIEALLEKKVPIALRCHRDCMCNTFTGVSENWDCFHNEVALWPFKTIVFLY